MPFSNDSKTTAESVAGKLDIDLRGPAGSRRRAKEILDPEFEANGP
jgi:hypothetical protein